MIFCARPCGVIRLMLSHFGLRWGRRGAFLLSGIQWRLRYGRRSVGTMSCGVIDVLFLLGRNFLWLTFMHLATMEQSKGCGTTCQFGFNRCLGSGCVCVWGDFNAVRHLDERRSPRVVPRQVDHLPFNRFIEENFLIDLPLSGRKYSWYKGDGLTMSRLDRFLLSEEWSLSWPNCTQVAQLRGVSDHCPLVLSTNEENWGPRPLRMLKCWKDIPGYQIFVRDKWQSMQVDGWGGTS
jgi:hypothetical protein